MNQKSDYHALIKELPEDERPQEKMIRNGAGSLSNAELLAIIIRTGTRDATSVEVGRKIIEYLENDLSYFHQMDVLELKRNPNLSGVGIVKACQIKAAIKQHASSIILAHNHPSGDTEPSAEDKSITRRLVDAGELIGISVLDHIIIGRGTYLSFKQEILL